jgi:acyl-CoA reductase-like NAD-dependent aldehyde dehydrogenase
VNAIVDRYFQVVAERLETGAVGDNINDTTELQALFGGWKLSGIGRELGPTRCRRFAKPSASRYACALADGGSLLMRRRGEQFD